MANYFKKFNGTRDEFSIFGMVFVRDDPIQEPIPLVYKQIHWEGKGREIYNQKVCQVHTSFIQICYLYLIF